MSDEGGTPIAGASQNPPAAAVPVSVPGALGTLDAAPAAAGTAAGRRVKPPKAPGEARWISTIFLAPAAVFLGAIVLYPLIYTLIRSLFHDGSAGQATGFAGLSNYGKIFSQSDALRALKNNLIWVLIVPALITVIGLIFAVLTERVRWSSAFKVVVFTPMAISFVASGVTWGLIYADQPSRGLGNAIAIGIHDTFAPNTSFPELHPSGTSVFNGTASTGYTTINAVSAPGPALLPVTGLNLLSPPKNAKQAVPAPSGPGLRGTVWNDFKLGGGGTKGQIGPGKLGIPGIKVQAVQNGKVVASTTTGSDGTFAFTNLTSGSYQLKLPHSDFTASYGGIAWLGKSLITPAIILAYIWIYAGFAMVLLAAGMAAIPREALEAARMDGATEFQVFRRITVPLLMPVLMVVFVTLVINVLKVFDIVFILSQSAGATGKYANVLATQLFDDYGTQQFGAASAVGIVLVILVLPAMLFQIRRFRRDSL